MPLGLGASLHRNTGALNTFSSAIPASATVTWPVGASAAADANLVIDGVSMAFGPITTADTQSAANSRAAVLQSLIDFTFSASLTTSVTDNVITLTLITAGAAGNSVTLAKTGTSGILLSGATFSGGADAP